MQMPSLPFGQNVTVTPLTGFPFASTTLTTNGPANGVLIGAENGPLTTTIEAGVCISFFLFSLSDFPYSKPRLRLSQFGEALRISFETLLALRRAPQATVTVSVPSRLAIVRQRRLALSSRAD
jgi:hypothetical protein